MEPWFPDRRQALVIRHRVEQRSRMGQDPIERGLLQPSALDSALARAQHGPWASHDLWHRVALLLRGIVQDHPFADGNKRTGFEIAETTLMVNGYVIVASADDVVSFQLDVATGRLRVSQIAAWLEHRAENLKSREAPS